MCLLMFWVGDAPRMPDTKSPTLVFGQNVLDRCAGGEGLLFGFWPKTQGGEASIWGGVVIGRGASHWGFMIIE